MSPEEMIKHQEAIAGWEERKTPPLVIVFWGVVFSIPLGLCCYYLLRYF